MRKYLFLVLFSILSVSSGFSMEDVQKQSEHDLNNPSPYHAQANGDPLTYDMLLKKAKDASGSAFAQEWSAIEKTRLYFSQHKYDFGSEGYIEKLPHEQWLAYKDEDFLAFRRAYNTHRGKLSQFLRNLTPVGLGIIQTEEAKRLARQNYNALFHDLDWALTILEINAKGYIGSIT
jgi:hypothetical protein